MFSIGPDSVFAAGPDSFTYVLNTATQIWGAFPSAYYPLKGGSAVMYRPWKIMKAGSRDTDNQGSTAIGTTISIDLKASSAAWKPSLNSMQGRVNHNLVVLPNGEVLVVGGTGIVNNTDNTTAVKRPEIWDPTVTRNDSVGRWRLKDSLDIDNTPRDYHSTALLLPDGRVLCGGGNADLVESKKLNIYCPPYLFSGDTLAMRPVITSAPERVCYGDTFAICMPTGSSSASIALLRPAAVTHGFDENQRYVPLTKLSSEASGSRVFVEAPADTAIAPPGDYMLFVLNSAGVPAVARWMRLGRWWNQSDAVPPDSSVLTVPTTTSSSITVSFNAPGDNGASGHASAYEVHYSKYPIPTDSVFKVCPRFWPKPPGCAGASQSFTIPELDPCTL